MSILGNELKKWTDQTCTTTQILKLPRIQTPTNTCCVNQAVYRPIACRRNHWTGLELSTICQTGTFLVGSKIYCHFFFEEHHNT